MSNRAWVVVIIFVAVLLGLGAWFYGGSYLIGALCTAAFIGIVEAVSWMRKRKTAKLQAEESKEPPISYEELQQLFETLDRSNPPECTHTLAETEAFLKSRNLPVAPTLKWLRANGGFCDCEVILNVADKWGEQVGWEPRGEGQP